MYLMKEGGCREPHPVARVQRPVGVQQVFLKHVLTCRNKDLAEKIKKTVKPIKTYYMVQNLMLNKLKHNLNKGVQRENYCRKKQRQNVGYHCVEDSNISHLFMSRPNFLLTCHF